MAAEQQEPSLTFIGGQSSRRSELTIKKFAEQEQVTERTVRNWITKGAVAVRRTAGGRLVRVIVPETSGK